MAANHVPMVSRHFKVPLNDPKLPWVIEISTDQYFSGDDWEPIYAWMRSDEAAGSYTEYWIDFDSGPGCHTYLAFSDSRTAVAFKLKFG